MRKLWLAYLLVCLCGMCSAQAVAVHGTVHNPDGSAFNGSISIGLAKSSVVNSCVSPAQVVPFPGLTVQIVSGVFTPTNLIPTSCLTPKLPYYIQVKDSKNQPVYSDNWYIPQTTSVDIGTLGEVQLASGITVSVPQAIVANPSGNQTISQPAGTSLTVNTLLANSFSAAVFSLAISTPANSSAACSAGQVWMDASYLYGCVATNTIRRIAWTTF